MLANPFTKQIINTSYFSECERDDNGYCLPRKGLARAIGGGDRSQHIAETRIVSGSKKRAIDLLRQGAKVSWSGDILGDAVGSTGAPTNALKRLNAERMTTVDIDGVKYGYNSSQEHSLEQIADLISSGEFPKKLIRANKAILFWGQPFPYDDYYSDKYGGKFEATATGGNGSINVYRQKHLSKGIYAHESAHNLAKETWGSVTPPDSHPLSPLLDHTQFDDVHLNSSRAEKFAGLIQYLVNNPELRNHISTDLLWEIDKVMGTHKRRG